MRQEDRVQEEQLDGLAGQENLSGWKNFATELTSEGKVRDLIKKEYDVRY